MRAANIDRYTFDRIKELTNVKRITGFTFVKIGEIMGVSQTSVRRVHDAKDYEDFCARKKLRCEEKAKREADKTIVPVKELQEKKCLQSTKLYGMPAGYNFEIIIDKGLAICRMYNGVTLIAQGHGHIFHDGNEGIAQAVSYGFKRLYEKIKESNNNGKF